ncbi:hypothetical protein GCM10009425_41300 [Pseudomonas asuensis]|uniref:Uncharacterized protein n=1 Tax=Pseudomonas asuensis TaxID=1825787 RepID=A0ABQ2H322_9PSED|nr:hypothetical protein [Pseudomonas asuensis]GGM26397.1 hypothetical protein GCM10009425_41300 [Pseudomonas asuensis]
MLWTLFYDLFARGMVPVLFVDTAVLDVCSAIDRWRMAGIKKTAPLLHQPPSLFQQVSTVIGRFHLAAQRIEGLQKT